MKSNETTVQVPPPASVPSKAVRTSKAAVAKPVAPPVLRPKAARRKAKPAPRSQAGLDQLARRLEADWQAALRKHEETVHQQFRDLRAALHKRKAASLDNKATARLRVALAPKLKPKKGRIKDLRRVEDALGDALAHIP